MKPKMLASQMILLVLITLFGTQLLIFTVFMIETNQNDELREKAYGPHFIDKMVSAVLIMENDGSSENLNALTGYRDKFDISNLPFFVPENLSEYNTTRSGELKLALGESFEEAHFKLYRSVDNNWYSIINHLKDKITGQSRKQLMSVPRNTLLQAQVRLTDGRWVGMKVYDLHIFPVWIPETVKPMFIFTLFFSILAILLVKRMTKPLAELAEKSNKLGKGQPIKEITPRGPIDIQNAINSFNTMRTRLLNVNDHRARALAAISHDIRTPLTSMRINAEFINEKDIQDKMLEKITEMEQICEATVTFALKDSWSEENRTFDITSLLESLCCDLSEQGMAVDFELANKIIYVGRQIALKRAFTNLINNGVQYGISVHVSIVEVADGIDIHIKDIGPGIPESEKERLFEPFERIDESRSRDSGGLGLGMAISLSVIRSHGGTIHLNNRQEKGLDVVVFLPI